jgi:hypothetical protein
VNDLKRSLEDLIDDTRLPNPPSMQELRQRTGPRSHQAHRPRRLLAGILTTAIVISGVVLAVAYGPRSSTNGGSYPPARQPSAPSTTTRPLSTTTTPRATSTTAASALARASASLESYVSAENARETAAGAGSSQAVWGTNVYESSPPVEQAGGYVAVAAFAFDPAGDPVQVLSYRNGTWSQVTALPPPNDPGAVDHPDALDLISEETPVVVGHATDGQSDFLIPFAGAGCGRGPIIADEGGAWRYISFAGPSPTTEVLGGNPQFEGSTLISDNDCAASVPVAQRYSWTWTYDPSSGDFVGTGHPGWPPTP